MKYKVSALINDEGDVWVARFTAESTAEAAEKYEQLVLDEIFVQILECEVTPEDDDSVVMHKTGSGWEPKR